MTSAAEKLKAQHNRAVEAERLVSLAIAEVEHLRADEYHGERMIRLYATVKNLTDAKLKLREIIDWCLPIGGTW